MVQSVGFGAGKVAVDLSAVAATVAAASQKMGGRRASYCPSAVSSSTITSSEAGSSPSTSLPSVPSSTPSPSPALAGATNATNRGNDAMDNGRRKGKDGIKIGIEHLSSSSLSSTSIDGAIPSVHESNVNKNHTTTTVVVRQCSAVNQSSTFQSSQPSSPIPFVGTFSVKEFIARAAASLNCILQTNPSPSRTTVRRSSLFKNGRPSTTSLTSAFYSGAVPQISLPVYLRRLVTHGNCSPSAFVNALILIDRLHETALQLSALSIHRVLAAALIVAVKITDDRTHRARFYAILAGLPCREEIVTLERAFLSLLSFRVFISPSDYERKLTQLSAIPLTSLLRF